MKKLATLMLAVLMIAALCISASAADLKAAKGTPTIDGTMDDAYKAAQAIAIANEVNGTNGKTKGTAYTLWDEKNIYVFIDVTDPNLPANNQDANMWNGDSAEFYMNLSGEASGDITTINAGQFTAPAPRRNFDKGTWQGRGGLWDAVIDKAIYATVETANGYAIEMQIPFDGFTPAEGAKITVAFGINSDEDGDLAREEQIFAGDAAAQSQGWSTVDSYDTMVLSADVYVAPVDDAPAADNTADAGIVVAAVVMACAAAVVLSKKSK